MYAHRKVDITNPTRSTGNLNKPKLITTNKYVLEKARDESKVRDLTRPGCHADRSIICRGNHRNHRRPIGRDCRLTRLCYHVIAHALS